MTHQLMNKVSTTTRDRAERSRELLPILQLVEDNLVETAYNKPMMSRNIAIFKDFCTGNYSYNSLGRKYNNLIGTRISQIISQMSIDLRRAKVS